MDAWAQAWAPSEPQAKEEPDTVVGEGAIGFGTTEASLSNRVIELYRMCPVGLFVCPFCFVCCVLACPPACLPAWLPVCLLACVLACLLAWLLGCWVVCCRLVWFGVAWIA